MTPFFFSQDLGLIDRENCSNLFGEKRTTADRYEDPPWMPARRLPGHVLPATDGASRIGMQLSSYGYPPFRPKVSLSSIMAIGENRIED